MSLESEIFANGFLSDEDDALKSKSGGSVNFGLNSGKLTKFAYTEESGKDKNGKAIEIEITVGEKVLKTWINEINKIYGRNGSELTDTESEEYKKNYIATVNQIRGLVTHYLKIFYTDEEIKAKIKANGINNLIDYFKFAATGVNNGLVTKGNDVDVFLQYQWNIASGQDKTFLELPKNMKDGAFICKTLKPVGEWKEVRNDEGLHYEDNNGNIHRFTKSVDFLNSNKGKQQTSGGRQNTMNSSSSVTASSDTDTW